MSQLMVRGVEALTEKPTMSWLMARGGRSLDHELAHDF